MLSIFKIHSYKTFIKNAIIIQHVLNVAHVIVKYIYKKKYNLALAFPLVRLHEWQWFKQLYWIKSMLKLKSLFIIALLVWTNCRNVGKNKCSHTTWHKSTKTYYNTHIFVQIRTEVLVNLRFLLYLAFHKRPLFFLKFVNIA